MFDQGKVALEMLPPTQDALELHLSRANYQANVWLQADKVEMNVNSPTRVLGWQRTTEGLQIVWNRLESVPSNSKCVELVTCGCESKCKTAGCKCFKSDLRCMCACDECHADCLNPG